MAHSFLKSQRNDRLTLSFDFHIHSKYSFDSLLTPAQIIKIAERKGLNGIAITDHGTIKGGLNASRLNKSKFQIIIGSEISTEEGDIIGLFLNEELRSTQFHDITDEIKSQGGLVVLPHPYKTRNKIPHKLLKSIDIIEVLNGRIKSELNQKACDLALETKTPMIGGSDAHLPREIGIIQTIFKNCTYDDFKDPRRFYKIISNNEPKIIGKESPKSVHYYSAIIGNIKKKQPLNIGRSLIKKMKSKAY